jgi:raffinose/stachyose/melibiose transport system substrate-binding protein
LGVLLTACGETATPVAPTATAAPALAAPTATTAAAPQGQDITLSVWTNRPGEAGTLLGDLAHKFETQNPGIKIDFNDPGQPYEQLLRVKMAAKDMPDVFATHGWAKLRYGDFLLDLRDQPWAANLDPVIKPAVTDDSGKVYALPIDQEKTGPVFNADIFKQYAVDIPSTWDQLVAACETIKTKSSDKVTCIHMGGGDTWPVGQYYDFFSNPLAITPPTNDAQALITGKYDWSKYTVLSQNLLTLQQKGYLNKDMLTAKYEDSAKALAEGKAAIGFYGPFLCEEALKTNPKMNCGIMPIPALVAGDQPTFVGGELSTWGIWKDSKHTDAAKKLVAFFAQPENIAAVANLEKAPAGLTGVKTDLGYLAPYYDKYANTRTLTYFDRVFLPSGMWDVLCKAGQDVLAGNATPDQVTQTIQKEDARLRAGQ